jgi:hypothetical protein
VPPRKGEATTLIRVYKTDAAWITDNVAATGVGSVAEAFRRLLNRRGERPVLVDVAAVAPSTSEPTLHPAPGTRVRSTLGADSRVRCSCAKPTPTPYGVCTTCKLAR